MERRRVIQLFAVLGVGTVYSLLNYWGNMRPDIGLLDMGNLPSQISPTDAIVLRYLREQKLTPPAKREQPYRLGGGENSADMANILAAVDHKRGGYFIECGANDGEFLSTSLPLERDWGWSGLLLEASPSLFQKLLTRNRKSWAANVCLSGRVEQNEFKVYNKSEESWMSGIGKIVPGKKYKYPRFQGQTVSFKGFRTEGKIDCFPLVSLLTALNVTTVDFFSLDVEGHEMEVLKTIPFDQIDIKVLFVEHILIPEGKEGLRAFLKGKGYNVVVASSTDFLFKKAR
ncbi:protein Star [Folsomia candida]|uniref:protein Star n=1 Tax=Folsomia candida TaxID=158441 RepID=UPI0016051A10|nr:protein Star [Folsomia candida]